MYYFIHLLKSENENKNLFNKLCQKLAVIATVQIETIFGILYCRRYLRVIELMTAKTKCNMDCSQQFEPPTFI